MANIKYLVIVHHFENATQNAILAIKDALSRLQIGGHVKPDIDKFAIVGHSGGGALTANITALAISSDLPKPKAIMPVQGANRLGTAKGKPKREVFPYEDFSKIPSDTLILAVSGDEDIEAGDVFAKKLLDETPHIPSANINLVTLRSDYHGKPPLVADHASPSAPLDSYDAIRNSQRRERFVKRLIEKVAGYLLPGPEVDALDYYGYWKLFDALCETAFYGKNREYALGNTTQQRYMGEWSDGTPVKELVVTNKP